MPTRLGQRRVVVAPRGVSRVACRDSGAVRKLASGRRTRSSHHGLVVGTLGKMLLGRQPFETIREDVANPGHFHEYTLSELLELGPQSGLRVERWFAAEYFTAPGRGKALYRRLAAVLPSRLRAGFTVVYRRPA
jgi:hypothetical protein